MSVASAIRRMIEAGLSVEQALVAAEILEQTMTPPAPEPRSRTSGAERMRRYRETRAANGLDAVFNAATHRPALVERDGPGCGYCGSDDDRCVDHIVPTSAGGTDDLGNLVLSCAACNGGKSGRPMGGRYQLQRKSAQGAHVRYLAERSEQSAQSEQSAPIFAASHADNITYNPSSEPPKKNPPMGVKKKGSVAATRLPTDWLPDLDDRDYAERHGITGGWLARETERFRNFWLGKSGAGGRKADWPATWRNWILTAAERGRPRDLAPEIVAMPAAGTKQSGKVYVMGQTPAFEAWCSHLGRSPPTDRNGGWWFDSEWPPSSPHPATDRAA